MMINLMTMMMVHSTIEYRSYQHIRCKNSVKIWNSSKSYDSVSMPGWG